MNLEKEVNELKRKQKIMELMIDELNKSLKVITEKKGWFK